MDFKNYCHDIIYFGVFLHIALWMDFNFKFFCRPDFDASREKLRKLGDAEGTLTKEEFNKMKQELEAEYLATFKKTVAMHETFLCRLGTHVCGVLGHSQ